MISEIGIKKLAEAMYALCDRAELVLVDGSVEALPIIDKEIEGDILKVFLQASSGGTSIESIVIKDKHGNIIIKNDRQIARSQEFGLIASVWIRFLERETEFFIGGQPNELDGTLL